MSRVQYKCSNSECNHIFFDEGDKPCTKCGAMHPIVLGTDFGDEKKLIKIRIDFTTDAKNQLIFADIMTLIKQLPTIELGENICSPVEQKKEEKPMEIPQRKWH